MTIAQLGETLHPLLMLNLQQEYPNKQSHVLLSKRDLQSPRERTPLFFGSFDWHSAVHTSCSLVRLVRLLPAATWRDHAIEFLDAFFNEEDLQAEYEHLQRPSNSGFELPYGIAWLLILCRELRLCNSGEFRRWHERLAPLETLAASRFSEWLQKLSHPIRCGQHSQSAFSMVLVWDWSVVSQNANLQAIISKQARKWYAQDVHVPLAYEPSAHDFLSPALCEAALMAKVFEPPVFCDWLDRFMPCVASNEFSMRPVEVADRNDGKLVHLDGLNLSRAWMLQLMAHPMAKHDPRRELLLAHARDHWLAAQDVLREGSYAGTHWLGTFMLYAQGADH